MKKTDCKHYEPVVENCGYDDYALVDEVCLKDKPLHHDQYDCDYCTGYEKKGK